MRSGKFMAQKESNVVQFPLKVMTLVRRTPQIRTPESDPTIYSIDDAIRGFAVGDWNQPPEPDEEWTYED